MGGPLKLLVVAVSAWTGVLGVCFVGAAGCTVQDNDLGTAVIAPMPPGPGRSSPGPLADPRVEPGAAPTPYPAAAPPPDAGPGTPVPGGSAGATDAAANRAPGAPSYVVAEVATWLGAAAGAYSIIHGSVCDNGGQGAFSHGDIELGRRGLQAGFSVISSSCGQGANSQWPRVKGLADHGHEIVNQSFSFACLGGAGPCAGMRASEDFAVEIDQATRLIQENTGALARYFAFPFDVCGPANSGALMHLRQKGYLGARCGGRGISETAFADGFASKSDVWGPTYSIYGASGPCMGLVRPNSNQAPESLPVECRRHVLNQYVDDAIAQKGWAIRTLTGFLGDPGAFQPISPEDYRAHLDYVLGKVADGLLWVEGPTAVLKYRWAREKCARPAVEGNKLRFPAPSPECQTYATVLSYVVTAADTAAAPASLAVTQAGIPQVARTLAPGRYLVNADPTKGDAVFAP